MKCDICGAKVEQIFLGKIKGTYMKNKNSKKKIVCPSCQRNHSKEELLKKI